MLICSLHMWEVHSFEGFLIENNSDVCFLPLGGNIYGKLLFKFWISYPRIQLPRSMKPVALSSSASGEILRFLNLGQELGLSGWQEARGQAEDVRAAFQAIR